MTTPDEKRRELEQLSTRVEELEAELAADETTEPFQPRGYYAAYYATTGFMLGIFGAMSSLLFNVVGSVLVGQHPLELIRVYLTFPLGDRALELDSGLALAIGCCLYLGTGMLLGIPMYLALTKWTATSGIGKRMLVASLISVVIWLVMYYGILSWLQPAVVDMSPQNYIVNRVPFWVALLTHLVFGWTMVLVYPLGDFVPYRRPMEQQ
jgi:hypothetical protein